MKSILEAGFILWGLFLIFGLMVVAYLVWMRWEEGRGGALDKNPVDADRGRRPSP